MVHGSQNGMSGLGSGVNSTPSSMKYHSGHPSSRPRSSQISRQRSESPMGSPHRSSSRQREREREQRERDRDHRDRERDSSNIRRREPPSPIHTKGQDSHEEEAVCNYDTNVTTLYELLESSNWEKARGRCRSHPHEVRTWIVRRDTITQKVRWKLLPLHAAVIFQSPTFVVSALIDYYPAAVQRRDDQGMLPLHLAFRYKEDNEELLELLLDQFPKGVLMKDKRDRMPLEHGRGSKFSAKMMRLYAEATVSGSRSLTLGASSVDSGNQKRHDRFDGRVSEVIAEYEEKNRSLKGMYEERIKLIQDQSKAALNQVRITTDEEKRKLVNCHVEEMEAMREMINSHSHPDGAIISDLEMEISQLRSSISAVKGERDTAKAHAGDLKSYTEDLMLQMRQVLQDQESLQHVVSQQQQELEKSFSRREQLLQNLLRQEQDERPIRVRRGSEIKQLVESSRTAVESLLAREPSRVAGGKPPILTQTPRGRVTNIDKSTTQHQQQHHYYSAGTPATPIKDDISAITENSNF